MAITITSEPVDTNKINPVYNPLPYVMTSNTGAIVKIIADIYINSVYQTSIESELDFGTANQFTFNLSSIARSFLSADFITGGTNQHLSLTESAKSLDLDFFDFDDISLISEVSLMLSMRGYF